MTSDHSKPVLVLNSSTLIVLYELNRLDLLKKLEKKFKVSIPSTVAEEMKNSPINLDHSLVVQVNINNISSNLQPYIIGLGHGELGALALAYKLRSKREAIVITDDEKARKTCQRLNIKVRGTVGLIKIAYEHNIISKEQAINLINQIKETSLYITDQIIRQAIQQIKTQENEHSYNSRKTHH